MSFRSIVVIVVLLELLIIAIAASLDGFTLTGLQTATRFSGRLSLAVFSVIFLFDQHQQAKLTQWLSHNPYLVFAIAHGIHLVELISYNLLSNNELIPIRLAGGFLAYILIFIMPYLAMRKKMGKVPEKFFNRFQNFYLFYIWFIFFMSYLPRIQGTLPHVGGSYWEFVVLFVWVMLMLVWKLGGMLRFSFARNT